VLKKTKNTIALIIAFIMFAGGNFAFALAHNGCIISTESHVTCEMECCTDTPCIDEFAGIVVLVDGSGSCCTTHVEEALHQDFTPPVVTKLTDTFKYLKSEFVFSERTDRAVFQALVNQKFITSDITLLTSNFRI